MNPQQASVIAAVEETKAKHRALARARLALRRRALVVRRQGRALLVVCPFNNSVKFQTEDARALEAWVRERP